MKQSEDKIDKATNLIATARHILVFTGAGISTNCGIPDFRGENGIYSFVKEKYSLPYPEAIFDISYFLKHPEPFFDLSKDFLSDAIQPSFTHKFLAWLEERGQIELIVTQNIDLLHQKAGNKKVLECHGTYSVAHCLSCGKEYAMPQIESFLQKGSVPHCKCGGVIKPDIVFFGEQLPRDFYNIMENPPETDLLLILGTSLQIQPASSLPLMLAKEIPSIIVNLDPTNYDDWFTIAIYKDLDEFSKIIWDRLK